MPPQAASEDAPEKESRSRSRSTEARVGGGTGESGDGSDSSAVVAAAAAAAARAAAARKAAADDMNSTLTRLMPAASKVKTTYAPVIAPQDAAAAAAAAADARSKLAQSLNAMFQPPPPSSPPPAAQAGANSSAPTPPPGAPPSTQAPAPSARATVHTESDRIARRLFIHNIPPGTTEADICGFFNGALLAVNAQTGFTDLSLASDKPQLLPVERCEGLQENGRFCFLDLRSHEWVVLCLKLDGITFNNNSLKVMRPKEYVQPPGGDPAKTVHIPELERTPKPPENEVRATAPPRSADCKLYIQNLPQEMGEDQVRDLLEQFGKLRVLNLIKNRQTGKHRGYGFFEYEDPDVTDQAIESLNGFVCGATVLSVQRSNFMPDLLPTKQHTTEVTALPSSTSYAVLSDPVVAIQVRAGRTIGEKPSRIVQLLNTVYPEDVMTDASHEAAVKDIRSEAEKYGPLEDVVIPRPNEDLSYKPGVGKVFLVYGDVTSARRAQLMLNGRRFDQTRVVCAAFFPEERFKEGHYTLT
ncbi:U2 snRNP auxiliary factor or splicing facotr, putative [Eimeria acervulina]|uniref:Splicing factor U2AF subunit n=1 Tax=Eimeria acervulina TaxID=5801 RepID=U6GEJ9_EIMAC|nr:U2 snRNP auxiliary factor or splicing facotr, putative [Eimeria acervulina]CDI77972.1 U2 snRNP auxiliary factor or splicing facotr, putative [Eimeria acervulina]